MEEKFKGCIVGGLIGDCLGGPFEDESIVALDKVKKFFSELTTSTREGQYNYTDDTAMAWNMLDSLFEKKKYDPKDMSTKFSDTYFKESFRYYGGHVTAVFAAWKRQGLVDVYQPAQLQFEGGGSYGNGGAMRIAPIALYHYEDSSKMVELGILSTRLTHSHPLGIVGALLQCWAVRLALDENPSLPLDTDAFITRLQNEISNMKSEYGSDAITYYCDQLEKLKEFILRDEVIIKDVVSELGNRVVATKSVATALYCFLRTIRNVGIISAETGFERTIQLAISLGGDTDTIACMAGSIAGSYYGLERIPVHLRRCCEHLDRAYDFGTKLNERLISK